MSYAQQSANLEMFRVRHCALADTFVPNCTP